MYPAAPSLLLLVIARQWAGLARLLQPGLQLLLLLQRQLPLQGPLIQRSELLQLSGGWASLPRQLYRLLELLVPPVVQVVLLQEVWQGGQQLRGRWVGDGVRRRRCCA